MNYASDIKPIYEELKKKFKQDAASDEIADMLNSLYKITHSFLENLEIKEWDSKVEGKEYISLLYNNKSTRAINKELYNAGLEISDVDIEGSTYKYTPAEFLFHNIKDDKITRQSAHDITVAIYSVAISFCSSIDLLKENDQKTPGTYFEILMGFFYARTFGVNPRKQLEVLNIGERATLPTDFIFDLGDNKPKYHIPIKTSTRERVVQVWSHQKVLDGVYGMGRFLGLLTCLAETNVSNKRNDVVEVCLPEQWQIYQSFIARLTRIYYLDIPNKYRDLNEVFPKIHVKEFGEFFFEVEKLCE